MIDVDHQINAVQRTVGHRTFEAGEARTVTISQSYATELEDLWDACTNAERIPRWFAPVTGDLRLHGRYQVEGNAGGTIETCDPPNGFTATWEYGGDVSWIEVRLSSDGSGRTRFELEHIAHVDDERWTEFGPGAVGVGWDLSVLGLFLHLETEGGRDMAVVDPWMVSDDGRRYLTECARRWGEAAIADGDDPEHARASADRTAAAYTATG